MCPQGSFEVTDCKGYHLQEPRRNPCVNFSRCSSPRNEISWKSGHATGTGSDCATLYYSEESPHPNSKPRYTYQDLLARKAMQLSDNLARHSMLQSMLEPTYPKKTFRQYYNERFHSHIRFSRVETKSYTYEPSDN